METINLLKTEKVIEKIYNGELGTSAVNTLYVKTINKSKDDLIKNRISKNTYTRLINSYNKFKEIVEERS